MVSCCKLRKRFWQTTPWLFKELQFNIKFMFLPYGRQSINEEDIVAVSNALRDSIITRGSRVEAFEQEIAQYVGAQYAVAFSSGSTALKGCYSVLNVSAYDKVITTPNTFIATASPALESKASVVFVDIDRTSGNLNVKEVISHVPYESLRGRVFIVPVHFAGIAVDMEFLQEATPFFNVMVIEDAAHALGSCYKDGKKVGCCAFSDMTVFSFHPVKQITTGEGGLVTTNSEDLYQKLKLFRNSGIEKNEAAEFSNYDILQTSSNYNMTEMQAALGLSQLKRLNSFIEKRRALVRLYRKALKPLDQIRLFDASFDERSAYHLLVVQIPFARYGMTRREVTEKLKEKNIGTQYHYIPLYRLSCFQKCGLEDQELMYPEMEAYYHEGLTLPLFPDMNEEDVHYVVRSLKEVLSIG